jgi:hypothetical protein
MAQLLYIHKLLPPSRYISSYRLRLPQMRGCYDSDRCPRPQTCANMDATPSLPRMARSGMVLDASLTMVLQMGGTSMLLSRSRMKLYVGKRCADLPNARFLNRLSPRDG